MVCGLGQENPSPSITDGNSTTGRDILPDYMEGLPPEYVVYCTDHTIKKPQSGQSPVGDRFKYAYDEYFGRPQEKSYDGTRLRLPKIVTLQLVSLKGTELGI